MSTSSGSSETFGAMNAQTGSQELPFKFRFWGVRGSVPTPGPSTLEYGGNTSCVEVRAGEQIIILDAGTGLRPLGRALVDEFGDKPLKLVLLLTHTHWDHIQGLPFFLPAYKAQNQLAILGYEGARNGLHAILTSQMATPFFPVGLRELAAQITIDELKELSFELGAVQVRAAFANHPGICVGYRLGVGGRSFAFFPDNELRGECTAAELGGEPEPLARFTHAQRDQMVEFVRGADALVMDTQYDAAEYQQHVGWGHGCLDEVVALALQAHVKSLYLFHHDPEHSDARIAQMVRYARDLVVGRGGQLSIEAAREGATVELTGSGARMLP